MQNILNKEFVYKGYTFNIKLELNTTVERSPNGKKYHTVTINCMDGDNYYKKFEVEDSNLESKILLHEEFAKIYVDGKLKDISKEVDSRFLQLGFK